MPPEEEATPFRRVAVLGLGLMGGSLVRALARLPDPPFVTGWSPEPSEAEAARGSGALSAATASPADAVREADLVVLATPLGAACALVEALAGALGADALLTDVVSLKVPLADAVRRAGLTGRWVGAHPMCGGEASGFGAARAGLYEGARVWIVPSGAPEAAVARVEGFWRTLGAAPTRSDAAAHDRLMVVVSHLPQLTANVLARVLEDADAAPDDLGPGGRDMTRLAGSSPAMWRDLLAHAPDTLPAMLREVADGARSLAERIERGDLDAVEAGMAATRRWREGR
jgi:prephenate dehydrogenase